MRILVPAAAAALVFAFASVAIAQSSPNSFPAPAFQNPVSLATWAAPSPQPEEPNSTFSNSAFFGAGAAGPPSTFAEAVAAPDLAEAAAPEPQYAGPSGGYYRWQVGLGYEFARFSSSPFDANMNGIRTTLTYYPTNWLGLEGSVIAAFGGTIGANDRTKYLVYGVGPRIVWQRSTWRPFAHIIVGGIHMMPQVAGQGKNGFAVQVGGGVEYPITPTFGAEFEADYVRSQLYSAGQNNLQVGAGFVVHF